MEDLENSSDELDVLAQLQREASVATAGDSAQRETSGVVENITPPETSNAAVEQPVEEKDEVAEVRLKEALESSSEKSTLRTKTPRRFNPITDGPDLDAVSKALDEELLNSIRRSPKKRTALPPLWKEPEREMSLDTVDAQPQEKKSSLEVPAIDADISGLDEFVDANEAPEQMQLDEAPGAVQEQTASKDSASSSLGKPIESETIYPSIEAQENMQQLAASTEMNSKRKMLKEGESVQASDTTAKSPAQKTIKPSVVANQKTAPKTVVTKRALTPSFASGSKAPTLSSATASKPTMHFSPEKPHKPAPPPTLPPVPSLQRKFSQVKSKIDTGLKRDGTASTSSTDKPPPKPAATTVRRPVSIISAPKPDLSKVTSKIDTGLRKRDGISPGAVGDKALSSTSTKPAAKSTVVVSNPKPTAAKPIPTFQKRPTPPPTVGPRPPSRPPSSAADRPGTMPPKPTARPMSDLAKKIKEREAQAKASEEEEKRKAREAVLKARELAAERGRLAAKEWAEKMMAKKAGGGTSAAAAPPAK